MSFFHFNRALKVAIFVIAICVSAQAVRAQLLKELPLSAQSIDVEDRVGEFLPLNAVFKDERGNAVGLGAFFKAGKPVVLTLNYSDCPGLCVAQLDMLVGTLKELNGAGIGEDFEIVTVSIDPSETPEKAARTKQKYTGLLRDTQAEKGWHFLTGKQAEIVKVANAAGFRYSYDKANKRYNHPAATYFVSSEGRICRCLLSLGTEPEQFKFALAEAAEGRLTQSLADTIIQMCYMYDPDSNRYSADARRMMAFAGAAFTMLLLGFTAPFWFSKRAMKPSPALLEGAVGPLEGAAKGPVSENAALQPNAESYNEVCNPQFTDSTEAKK